MVKMKYALLVIATGFLVGLGGLSACTKPGYTDANGDPLPENSGKVRLRAMTPEGCKLYLIEGDMTNDTVLVCPTPYQGSIN